MELKKVDMNNIWEITKLSVFDEQKDFVATNTQSILEAYVTIVAGYTALPFGIYENEKPIGFVMFGFDNDGDEESPAVSNGNYSIWRFMIDKEHQHKGFGRKALNMALDYLRSEKPCGAAEKCWLSYEPENEVARALYLSCGFTENGEMCGEEVVAEIKL